MRGYACIGLDNPKAAVNVGSALRAAGCYGAAMVAMTGNRSGKTPTDTMKQYRHRPLLRVENLKDVIPYDCVPVAVDLIEGAISLPEYEHPERAFYIFGAEDATLGERVTSWCRDTIYIPTDGCMNLAATVNVVLYDRLCKQLREA
jgi:tRNA(Leu) C34 or U34 (ribose-2'-O)-methylase TrmL